MSIPHLVLLPGMDGGASLSRDFRKALKEQGFTSRVLAYPREPLDYERLAAWALGELPNLPQPAILCAESFGGPLALHLLQQTTSFCAVVFVATFARPPIPRGVLRFGAPPGLRFRNLGERLAPRVLLSRESTAYPAEQLRASMRQVPNETMQIRARELARVDLRGAYRCLTIPALVLTPRNDRVVRRPLAEERDPKRVTKRLLDGPHLLLQSEPGACADTITDWWSKLDPSTRSGV